MFGNRHFFGNLERCAMTSEKNELIYLRIWKNEALDALAEYRHQECRQIAMMQEMHNVIATVADSMHQAQLALNKYVDVKNDFFTKKKGCKK